jgi:hypothetical protein
VPGSAIIVSGRTTRVGATCWSTAARGTGCVITAEHPSELPRHRVHRGLGIRIDANVFHPGSTKIDDRDGEPHPLTL